MTTRVLDLDWTAGGNESPDPVQAPSYTTFETVKDRDVSFDWIQPAAAVTSAAVAGAAAPAAAEVASSVADTGLLSTAKGLAVDTATAFAGDQLSDAFSAGKEALGFAPSTAPPTSVGTSLLNAAGGAVASYGGGIVAEELFDGKGYSGPAGSLSAGAGYVAATGGSAALTAAAANLGWVGGPLVALGAAVLGSAIGSLFGNDDEDYRFRTYSGELGEGYSDVNKDRYNEGVADRGAISTGDPGMDYWRDNHGWGPTKAYESYSIGNTFQYYDPINPDSIDMRGIGDDYASFDGPFGKYTVGHVDDIPGRTNFAQGWVDVIEQLDTAVATLLTPEEQALARDHLGGSIQRSREWHNTSGSNMAVDSMIGDRYAAIFEAAGRPDLYNPLAEGMNSRELRPLELLSGIIDGSMRGEGDMYSRPRASESGSDAWVSFMQPKADDAAEKGITLFGGNSMMLAPILQNNIDEQVRLYAEKNTV